MKRELLVKGLVISLILTFLVVCATPVTSSISTLITPPTRTDTWIVDNEGDGDFSTIQAAIDAASEGDTIEVYSGTYPENIWIYTDSLTVIGYDTEYLNGSDSGRPIIDGSTSDHVVEIKRVEDEKIEDIELTGFAIRTSGVGNAGVNIYHASDIKIDDCEIANNDRGVLAIRVDTVNVIQNEIHDNSYGVYFENSDNNDIIDNNVDSNTDYGIRLEFAPNNDISQNTVSNCGTGVYIVRASGNEITSNDFLNNTKSADFLNCFNYWRLNYWDDNTIPTKIYIIWGSFKPFPGISWLVLPIPQVDWAAST